MSERPTATFVSSAARAPPRRPTVRGRSASFAAALTPAIPGFQRSAGPTAASLSSMSSGAASAPAPARVSVSAGEPPFPLGGRLRLVWVGISSGLGRLWDLNIPFEDLAGRALWHVIEEPFLSRFLVGS